MMKNDFIKISGGIVLAIVLVLIYTAAVTQTSGAGKHPDKKIAEAVTNETDTTDIGEPTGDNPWKELDNLVKTYYVKTGVFYQGSMKLLDGNTDNNKLLEEKKFEYTYFNNEYSYSLSPLEVVNKKNYAVIINHDDKVIAVVPKITEKIKNNDLFNIADFKKIIEEQRANVKVTRLGNEKILTIDSIQDPNIQGYRIYYSPQTYKISKMLIGMVRLSPLDGEPDAEQKRTEEAPKADTQEIDETETEIEGYYYYLEINYSTIKELSFHKGEFNPENKFVKIDGKKIELTPAFKEYELYNSAEY